MSVRIGFEDMSAADVIQAIAEDPSVLDRWKELAAKQEAEIRHMLVESAGDQGTIGRLKRELGAPCQRCEMHRTGGVR